MRVKPFYSNFKIKNKIFSISLLLLLIFCLIGIVSYQFYTSMYEERIAEQSVATLQLSSTVIDEELNSLEVMSFQISTDEFIQRDLRTITNSQIDFEIFQARMRLIERLLMFANSEHYISSIQVRDVYGERYISGSNTRINSNAAEELMSAAFDAGGANVWSRIDEPNYISASRLIRRKDNLNLNKLGYLVITIDMNRLVQETLNFSPNKNFIITMNEEIYYQSEEGELGTVTLPIESFDNGYKTNVVNGNDYLTTYKHSRFSDLTYYHFLPFGEITRQTEAIKRIMVLLFLFMLILTVLLSRRAARNISKPLEKLSERMKQVQQGNFGLSFEDSNKYYNDEVGLLHVNFKLMIDKINELIRENYTKQLMIKETEYKALQAQINPHFLYNTLDSINWLAKMNQQEKISVMVEALGNMMRNIISKKEAMITIREEMEIVNNYITIQKHRYDKRLHFSFNSLLEHDYIKIPKLTIQPIVENAIQHGLEEMLTECHISINIWPLGEEIEIVVEDNGPGIEERKMEGIYKGEIRSKSSGIGLKNINERIKLMFGEQYGITIESEVGKGTKVKILLPSIAG
ncbi:sensor histidine kinase [Jeotgalibacillus sp. S-D1]|uniref:cache domain-containing sensor histidine kinase n=1 Tax=Jeotgalibacillus sp. S-D1 TaxID=2552189 RepID=UPI00105A265E|nr:sensor histidine kinase [Jeotgalibacillus sp. S-D1]TDL34255.1 sensor histidine kinase [Jeotgalibacillus sp. S-D1]